MADGISCQSWKVRRLTRQQPLKQSIELNTTDISDFKPPKWLKLTSDDYKRILNLEAMYLTKRDRRRGGRYQVKEALVAVHNAFHNCDGPIPITGCHWRESSSSQWTGAIDLASTSRSRNFWEECPPWGISIKNQLLNLKSWDAKPIRLKTK